MTLDAIVDNMIDGADLFSRRAIGTTVQRFGARVVEFLYEAGIRLTLLAEGEQYRDASPVVRNMGLTVDSWPSVPVGIFVVQEKRVYLQSTCEMAIAHELAHGLDAALGNGTYLSRIDPEIRDAYKSAGFVTPYAASGIDEFFAESTRSFVECNTIGDPWPKATKKRLRERDPKMYAIIARIFANPRYYEQVVAA